jgi:tRNA(adenine34) deaminase
MYNNNMTDEEFMQEALKEAKLAYEEGEVPVGAVLVVDDEIVARGHNERERKKDVTSHAELECLRKSSHNSPRWTKEDATIYVTLEPCLMCAAALSQARIKRIVYAADDPKEGAIVSKYQIFDDPNTTFRPLVSRGPLQKEALSLLASFFAAKRKK